MGNRARTAAPTTDHAVALERASEHLQRLGYTIDARDLATRYGRIDLVASDATTLVIVDVAVRAGETSPWDSVGEHKRRQVRRMAVAYLAETPDRTRRPNLRFDAIGVTVDQDGRLTHLDHLEGAF
jgi:putative endonuclease